MANEDKTWLKLVRFGNLSQLFVCLMLLGFRSIVHIDRSYDMMIQNGANYVQ